MPRSLLLAIAAGVLGAVLFVSAASVPLVGLLVGQVSPAVPMAAGLILGPAAAWVAGITGAVVLALFGGGMLALGYLAADALPAIVVTQLALRSRPRGDGTSEWYPPGHVLAWLAAVGAGVIALTAIVTTGIGDGFEAMVRDGLARVLSAFSGLAPDGGASEEAVRDAAARWAPVLPGGLAASWLFRATVSALLAQWAAARSGRAARPTPRYVETFLPPALSVALAASMALGWLLPGDAGYAARNMALVLGAPFLAQGLTVIHAAVRSTRHPSGWLTAFYVVFLFASGLAVLAMIGLGLVDQLMRLRTRMSAGRQEEE